MKIFRPAFAELPLDIGEIYRNMGSDRYVPDKAVRGKVEETLGDVSRLCEPEFGYKIFVADYPEDGQGVIIDGVFFRTGAVISPLLSGAQYFALFVATAGRRFDDWLHAQKLSGDILDAFSGDAIGSEIAEAAARMAAGAVEREAEAQDMRISNSYSPGYCGWNTREQEKLFGLLPPYPCGIELNGSCLMSPVKSVSGLIAIGGAVSKQAYGCEICRKKDCYKKRHTEAGQ